MKTIRKILIVVALLVCVFPHISKGFSIPEVPYGYFEIRINSNWFIIDDERVSEIVYYFYANQSGWPVLASGGISWGCAALPTDTFFTGSLGAPNVIRAGTPIQLDVDFRQYYGDPTLCNLLHFSRITTCAWFSACCCHAGTATAYCGIARINYSMHTRPARFNLHYFSYNSNANPDNELSIILGTLPSNDPITLAASRYLHGYIWTYRYYIQGNPITGRFPPSINFPQRQSITFTGLDILPNKEDISYLIRNNGWVYVFIDYEDVPSDTIRLRPMLSSPHIVKSYYIPETCNDENDARLRIKLSRALLEDETIHFTVNGSHTRHIRISPTKFEIIPRRTVGINLEEDLPVTPGIYEIKIADGTYPNIHTSTFFSSPNHIDTVIVSVREIVKFDSIAYSNVSCFGGFDGRISFVPTGGVGDTGYFTANLYSLVANDTIIIASLSNLMQGSTYHFKYLPIGRYLITLTDSNLCHFFDENVEITITQPASPLYISYISATSLSGFETGDGEIEIAITGGTGNFHVWLQRYGIDYHDEAVPRNSNATFRNLSAGTYRLLVRDSNFNTAYTNNRDSANFAGCWVDTVVVVTQPYPLIVRVVQTEFIRCFGDSTAVLVAHAEGGVQFENSPLPYIYNWFNVNDSTVILSKDSIISGLPAGKFQVRVVDYNGNTTYSDTIIVSQPKLLAVTFYVLQEIMCPGDRTGKVRAVVTGGTYPFTFHWISEDTYITTSDTIENVDCRNITAFVEDSKGCRTERQVINLAYAHSLFVRDNEIVNPSCFGTTDGSIVVDILGGVAPFAYLWNDGVTTRDRNNLPAGEYTITVTDSNDCRFTQSFVLTEPNELTFDNLIREVIFCRGSQIILDGSIDFPNLTYQWTDIIGNILSNEAVLTIDRAGTFRVTATTPDNCQVSAQVRVIESETEINADFVIASQAPRFRAINAVNISRTQADSILWIVPQNATVLSQTDERLQVQFNANGQYIITMIAHKDDCFVSVSRTVTVVDEIDIEFNEVSDSPFLKQFIVVPNPTDGNFSVLVQLSEPADYELRLFSDSRLIETRTVSGGLAVEEIEFPRTDLPAGVYFLQFISDRTTATIKIIVR